jgi:hypothetical protein
VAARSTLPAAAIVPAPAWIPKPSLEPFASEAGLRWTAVAGSPNARRLRTEESYRGVRPELVAIEHLAGPDARRVRLDRLDDVARASMVDDPGGKWPQQLVERQQRAQQSGLLVNGVTMWQLQTMDAPPALLPATAEAVLKALTDVTIAETPDDHPLANAGVHLVRLAPALVHRTKLFTVLLQATYDPRLQPGGDIAALKRVLESEGESVFAASRSLFEGILIGDNYLGPLLGALSPAVWAFSAHRVSGVIVYTLGAALAGTTGDAAELLQVLPSQGASATMAMPKLPAQAPGAALAWWTTRLNELFGVLTDPAVFTDTTGTFRPPKQLHALLSVEQLFRRVGSIQTDHRDGHARRVLLFTVLDTLERLTGRPVAKLCSRPFAQATLDRLDAELSGNPAAEILLPAARRAIEALHGVQAGFYLARQLGSATISVPDENGSTRELDFDDATAEYIKVLRDATHGHGSNRAKRVELTNALLAHHTGQIPHDLSLLGYLYLLDMLTRPEDLARHLYAGGRD